MKRSDILPFGGCKSANVGACSFIAILLFLGFALIGMVTGCGGKGGSTSSSAVAAPSNLIYPQSTITGSVGQAISSDVPTVSGTLSSYSVTPALPAGLTLNASTGTLSGTPTAASAQASYIVSATNPSGSTTAKIQITINIAAPSNLVYPQTTMSAIVGQAISPDVPAVMGTVTSYGISPALPPGLAIDSSNGTIAGTPIAASVQASYTVTAQNVSGTATASLKIGVSVPGPSSFTYPQAAISTFVGQEITPDVPTNAGLSVLFSVAPALPAGLSLNSSTGVLSGTPTATASQALYTVTATNSGGATNTSITLTVGNEQNTLLDLGHANSIPTLRLHGDRVLSADTLGHWVLWTYSSGALIASGDGSPASVTAGTVILDVKQIDMAGQIFVVSIPNALEIRSVLDGHPISLLVYPGLGQTSSTGISPWWRLASDGTSIAIGTPSELSVFDANGQSLVTKTGDYSLAKSFAAAGTVFVAQGPAGANVIESISTTDGTSTVSAPFSGQFNSWFVDQPRFLANQGNAVWVYSSSGVQQALMALPTTDNLTGQGNWIWTYEDQTPGYPLEVYPVGSTTSALSYTSDALTAVVASGTTIGVLPYGAEKVSVIDLSGSSPVKADYATTIAKLGAYAAGSSSQWVVGNAFGALLDGASLAATPKYFGHGNAWSIAGNSNRVAISTAIGEILVFDPSGPTLDETIWFPSGKLALSSDATVLGASATAKNDQYTTDRTLNFYSLPSGNVIKSFPYVFQDGQPDLLNFALAGSGATIAQETGTSQNSTWSYGRRVSAISGSPVIWSDTPTTLNSVIVGASTVALSPDGTLIGVSNYAGGSYSTNILHNGSLVTAVAGVGIGWIDDGRILVNQYSGTPSSTGSSIYSAAGVLLAAPALPELKTIQTVTTDSVYDPSHNAIYSLTNGQPVWTGSFGGSGLGAVAGSYVIYQSGAPYQPGHSIVLETH